MILELEDKVLVVHRRLFPNDQQRYFIGIVDAYEYGIAKVTGYSYVKDHMSGKILSKNEARTKVLSLASGTLMVYVLPREVDVEVVRFLGEEAELHITDNAGFHMDLTEIPHEGKL